MPGYSDPKELVRRFYLEAINKRDLSAVDRLLDGAFLGAPATGKPVEFTSTPHFSASRLAVLPRKVPNAADGWLVADG